MNLITALSSLSLAVTVPLIMVFVALVIANGDVNARESESCQNYFYQYPAKVFYFKEEGRCCEFKNVNNSIQSSCS
jgi:hypothetical protein